MTYDATIENHAGCSWGRSTSAKLTEVVGSEEDRSMISESRPMLEEGSKDARSARLGSF